MMQIENKNKLWNKIRKKKNVDKELLQEYNKEKTDISKKIKQCKTRFFQEKLGLLEQNKNTVWDVVNEITNKKNKKKYR